MDKTILARTRKTERKMKNEADLSAQQKEKNSDSRIFKTDVLQRREARNQPQACKRQKKIGMMP